MYLRKIEKVEAVSFEREIVDSLDLIRELTTLKTDSTFSINENLIKEKYPLIIPADSLFKVICNYERADDSVTETAAACYEPHHAFLFYNN